MRALLSGQMGFGLQKNIGKQQAILPISAEEYEGR